MDFEIQSVVLKFRISGVETLRDLFGLQLVILVLDFCRKDGDEGMLEEKIRLDVNQKYG